MASRYERVCLIEKLRNNPNVNVELLAGAVLRDNLENALKCQLKFRVIGNYAAQKVGVSISCFNANGETIGQTIHTYDNGPYEHDTDYGTDVLIEIAAGTTLVEVSVCSAVYDNPVQLTLRNHTPSKLFQSGTICIGEHQDDGSVFYSSLFERGETRVLSLFPGRNELDFMISGLGTSSVTFDISNDATMNVAFNYKTKSYEVTSGTPNTLKILKIQ
jgi:hypothetical protein